MRTLFTTQPGAGHVQSLVPVAAALERAGHQVAFCSTPSFRPRVQDHGFECFQTGADWDMSWPWEARSFPPFPDIPDDEGFEWVVANIWAGITVERSLPDLLEIARAWSPDLVVRESAEFAGSVVAERLGLPHASVATGALYWARALIHEPLARHRASVGLPADRSNAMPYRYLHLSFMPPSFGDSAEIETTHYLRHRPVRHRHPVLAGWMPEASGRPIVLASLGTTAYRPMGVLRAIVDGLRDEPVELVVAIGDDHDPCEFGPQPPNVRLERVVPQTLILPRCALFITHAGFTSVKEAIGAGVPMLTIPIMGDHGYNATRCTQLGFAQLLRPEKVTPSAIRDRVRTLIGDPRYARRARQYRREMSCLPPLERAVTLLERLALEHCPSTSPGG